MLKLETVNFKERHKESEVITIHEKLFHNISARMQQWMSGRYGADELSRAVSIAAVEGLLISCIILLCTMVIPALFETVRSIIRVKDGFRSLKLLMRS